MKITERDQEVVDLLRKGMTIREIAMELGISITTTKRHIWNMSLRLNIGVPQRGRVSIAILNALDAGRVDRAQLAKLKTDTQREIATQVAIGKSNREIASAQGVVEGTVRNKLRDIYDLLGVWSRLELRNMLITSETTN